MKNRKINTSSQKYLILQIINSEPNKVIHQNKLSSNTKITLQTVQSQISGINRNEGAYKNFRVNRVEPQSYELVTQITNENNIIKSVDDMGKKALSQLKRRKKSIEVGRQTRQGIQAENQLMNQILRLNIKVSAEMAQLLV